MRTSNKLIIATFLLLLLSLFGYDCMLKAAYKSGDYKDPYSDFKSLDYKDFDAVDIVSSTAANVKFVQGPFSIKVGKITLDYVKIKQQGRRLQIDANFEDHYMGNSYPYIIVISCPKLAEISTNASYIANKKLIIDTTVRDDWNMRQVLIDGFKQDSLSISQDYGSTVMLANNTIRSVNAVVGKSPGSGSKFIVLKTNQFQKTNFDIRTKSRLLLNDAIIHTLSYHLADSAKLIVTGAAQGLIKN
jgi:hypothetical protein